MKMRINLHPAFRLPPIAWILLVLMAIGFIVSMTRFGLGIGAISNLNDAYPWGFWISFDIFTGIAIASGAFILAALVYIFEIEAFRPLLIPSILTALLGYIMEVLALFVDLGRPERIWHMMIYQNDTSTMLVIGLCVMFYLVVLAVLFAPTVFDRFKQSKYAATFRKLARPFVILAVVISTIHQASLGSLMLIQPTKLHPLWWTPFLPVLFFTSALTIGLCMIILESSLSAHYFKHGLETHLLEKLARAIPYTAGIYLVLKFAELAVASEWSLLFTSGSRSLLFWTEILMGVLAPIVLFANKKMRRSSDVMLVGAVITLIGMLLNRFNVSWFAVDRLTDVSYVPSLVEILVSIAIFSAGILAFGLLAKHFPVFETQHQGAHAGD